MFLAIVFLAIGTAILLNTLGMLSGGFWGFFWAIVFLAIGIKMLIKQGGCPICGWKHWEGKMYSKMHDHCGCGCEEENGEEEPV